MADPVTDTIGLVSGVLGIVSFLQSLFPAANAAAGTIVRIKAGLGDDSSSELGGTISAVYAFDINNDYLGNSASMSMGAGDSKDFTVSQQDPGRRGDFISIANSDDAVCIEWITVAQYDGTRGGAWTGDIGYSCGQHWYYGNQAAGVLPDGSGDYVPYCTWFDGDGTNGIPSASLKFTSDAYGSDVQSTQDSGYQCSASIFSADPGPIAGKPDGAANKKLRNRSLAKRSSKLDNHLVVSNIATQTAEKLCSSATSYGPDFVGVDRNFCDLATKTLSPLCTNEDVDGCVEVQMNGTSAVVTKRDSVARRSVHTTKSYGKVLKFSV